MVLSIGEILVDIFMEGDKKTVFPGGAPFNVAANIAHFNGDVSFYGVVGNDEYGHFLLDFAKKKIPSALIEVKDDTSRNVIIVFTTIFIVLVGGVIFIKKKTSK